MGKSESQMDIMEKTTKPRKHRWTVMEIGLSIMLLLLSNINTMRSYGLAIPTAARLLQNMDPSVDPCQNFYQYACGGWLERHVIPETSSLHSVFNILRDELEIVLKGILEMEKQQDRLAFKKAKMLYRSCMNESVIEQRDSQPLLKLIDSIGDWPVASEDWNSTAGTEDTRLEDTLAALNAHYNKKILLEMFVWPDDRDSSRHIIHIDQPALGMPSRDYYLNDGNYRKVREAYLQFMVSMAKIAREDRNLTQDDERVWEEMMQVMKLEREIANATSPAEERNDITVLYNKMTLRDVQDTFSLDGFNWTRYIQGIMGSVSIAVQPEEPIVVYCSPYLEKLSHILSRYDRRSEGQIWPFIVFFLLLLLLLVFYALHGTTVEEARWRDCVRYVQSNMENAVGALYVQETFAGDSKRMVGELIRKIQEAFVETLEELNWMDDQSKEKAREKVRPQHSAKCLCFFLSLVLSVFPAGILQPPFFSEKQLQALNFGGIGMVIGHEITHGFDDHGRNFDKHGNMYNWWSNYSTEHFEDQSKCMVQQYGTFSWKLAGGQNVSGISTLGENIADNGGVRQAYKAYMKWVEREGEEPRLPGLDLDHKQLFFLNFAQVWCGACRPEYAIQSIKTDPHSPLEYRVLGSLQNFEAFSEAFQCERGAPMNPDEKCRVW
uniref:Membrane metallo-endopeptidase-like 1 n=1 Tax=Pygocentrus nattereri TaxID=42514 RepID=A0AAR2IMW7_PYGNA